MNTFGILRLLLINKVAVYLKLSTPLNCDKLKWLLIAPTRIKIKQILYYLFGMRFCSAHILQVCVLKTKYAQITLNADPALPHSSDFHNSNLFSEHLGTHCTLEL